MKKFYITTAIPYVNAPPHIGHALEFVQADVLARFHRLQGEDVFFLTGTDENAQKNVLAAEKKDVSTKELVDENTKEFEKMIKLLGISNNDFIRTTDQIRHWPGAIKLWQACEKSGDIYKKSYTGLYCVGCEAFLTEKDLKDGVCPEHLKPPETVSEENYFFRLTKYQKKLERLIENDELKIIPKTRKNEVLSFIRSGLEDFSISRPVKRMKGWGIPVPGDEKQIIYVWFDALSNYITALGYGTENPELFEKYWPADIHVIGKGIIRFHAVYWPAMLLSAGVSLPKSIFVHGYVNVEGQKMSKSLGNIVDPNDMVDKYGLDALRFFILKEISPFDDGDFSEKTLVKVVNNELVANIGNFIYRTLSFIDRYFGGIVPEPGNFEKQDTILIDKLKESKNRIHALLREIRLRNGLQEILALSGEGNKYFQDSKPWELIKKDKKRCGTVLYLCANLCRSLGIFLYPYLPDASKRLWEQLNLKEDVDKNTWNSVSELKIGPGHRINKPKILFEKLEQEKQEKSPSQKTKGVMNTNIIKFKDFKKLDLRIGRIERAERVEGTDKLIKMIVDIGDEKRQIIAGIADAYKPEDIEGKEIPIFVNLEPKTFRGLESQGMLLCAEVDGKPILLHPDKEVPPGSIVC
jgi:methionyl-tRNA synthetase